MFRKVKHRGQNFANLGSRYFLDKIFGRYDWRSACLELCGFQIKRNVILNFFSHTTLNNLKNALKDEPLGFTAVSILLGFVIYMQTWAQNVYQAPIIGTALGTILFLAIIEEYIKHLMVRVTDDKKLKDIDDAITLSIVVGLAFAFIETIIYSGSSRSNLWRKLKRIKSKLIYIYENKDY